MNIEDTATEASQVECEKDTSVALIDCAMLPHFAWDQGGHPAPLELHQLHRAMLGVPRQAGAHLQPSSLCRCQDNCYMFCYETLNIPLG